MSKILIVEDEQNILAAVKMCLKRAGYEVFTATSGAKGVLEAMNSHPDLILLDLLLPDIHGNLLCRALKENNLLSHIPIVVMSAYSEQQALDDAFKAGAIDYLVKPFEPETLKEMVRKHVS